MCCLEPTRGITPHHTRLTLRRSIPYISYHVMGSPQEHSRVRNSYILEKGANLAANRNARIPQGQSHTMFVPHGKVPSPVPKLYEVACLHPQTPW